MRKSNLNKQIFSVLLLSLFCFLFWATSENPSSKESEPVKNSETQEEETKWECNVCKSKFTHNGYELDENGNCKSIEEPMQGFLCSCNCAKEARKKSDEVYNEVLSNDSYKADENCSFESDNDVLMYLIGKSFTQDGGNIKIKFDESGATISGVQYQWMSYTSLGGYKGKVKLSSIDPSNPDGTITLYVSCREKSITDGQIVLFLN